MTKTGPIVRWLDNDLHPTRPPNDAPEWIAIIRTISVALLVDLVESEPSGWRVSRAEQLPVHVGHGPYETAPLDLRSEVIAALRKAGKGVSNS